MEQTKRWGLSAAQKRELWERWKRGQSSNDIARAFAKLRGSVYKVLSSSGGIEPPARRRSRLALSLAEREEIAFSAGSNTVSIIMRGDDFLRLSEARVHALTRPPAPGV